MARSCPRGLSVIEVLLGLAITAILATSVFTAMNASAKSVKANQDLFTATQTTRLATRNVARAIRLADECEIGGGTGPFSIPAPPKITTGAQKVLYRKFVNSSGATAYDAYIYDAENQQLLLDTRPKSLGSASPDMSEVRSRINSPKKSDSDTYNVYILAREVSGFSFVGEYINRGTSLDPVYVLTNVQARMQVTSTQNTGDPGRSIDLCESAAPRHVFIQN